MSIEINHSIFIAINGFTINFDTALFREYNINSIKIILLKEMLNLKETLRIYLGTYNNESHVERLIELIKTTSATVSLKHLDSNAEYEYLEITYDQEAVYKKVTRKAGRKKKFSQGYRTYAQVKEMMKTDSAENVAKELGVSRSTLFRRIKSHDKLGFDDSSLFM